MNAEFAPELSATEMSPDGRLEQEHCLHLPLLAFEPILDVIDPGDDFMVAPPGGAIGEPIGGWETVFLDETIDHGLAQADPTRDLVQLDETVGAIPFGIHLNTGQSIGADGFLPPE
jgi:hypothetical protein